MTKKLSKKKAPGVARIYLSTTGHKELESLIKSVKSPLEFSLKKVLLSLKNHPKYKRWMKWGGRPRSLGLLLCSDKEIRAYNRDFRKMDKATDVLSFPSIEAQETLGTGEKGYLGDMIISMETVERAALRESRQVDAELVEVFVHGVLHLLGFDHLVGKGVTKKDALEMKTLQRELFEKLWPLITKRYGNFVKKRKRHQRIS